MSISSWFPWRRAWQHKGRSRSSHSPELRRRTRLACEQLEDRTVPSNYPVATVPELIDAINAANQSTEADTIELVAGTTFTLTQVINMADNNGLPTISASGGSLTILGNGDTIARRANAKPFRLFRVAAGATLTLENLTLTGGLAEGTGGAIHNQGGAVTLSAVTVTGNSAVGAGYAYEYRELKNGHYRR